MIKVGVERSRSAPACPGTAKDPDVRSAARYLWWLIVCQRRRVCWGTALGTAWMVCLMLPPYLIARTVDEGIRAKDMPALVLWSGAVLAVGLLNALLGVLRHRTMTLVRADAALRTVHVLSRRAVEVGGTLPRRLSAGEVVSIGAADAAQVSQTLTITGPGVGAVIAYIVVTGLLLSMSPLLAAVVLLGVPALVLVIGPLLARLHAAQTSYREHQARLTARAGDIVAGLRVLSGIGGKGMFAARYDRDSRTLLAEGYRVGAVTSWIDALAAGLPVLFLAAVTWLVARMTAAGEITVGDMIAVYGYTAVLVTPISFFIEGGGDLGRGLVAAGRVVDVLRVEPDVRDGAEAASCPPGPLEMSDPDSGLVVRAGELLAIAAARPADALAIAARLARYTESDAALGGVPLRKISVSEVRRRVLLVDTDAYLFAGSLADCLTAEHDHDEQAVATAMWVAAAADIASGLPDGLRSHIHTQGRNLSGGQRQRLRVARALLADPEVLILVEPTSAVDAHTEALIADRLRSARAGRTTVVVSTSPLLLGRADRVAHVTSGRVAATGSHTDLLAGEPDYRELVFRGDESSASELSSPPRPDGREGEA
ncbi:ABC transporter ATP-binding protein [Actinomadura chokoriensis]|uniref:ABC transporter ATP-binding protein n=1 Tax=Actinomadura chokoriensis TaxID=454156 RepID=A0ABV4QY53_9ACTN